MSGRTVYSVGGSQQPDPATIVKLLKDMQKAQKQQEAKAASRRSVAGSLRSGRGGSASSSLLYQMAMRRSQQQTQRAAAVAKSERVVAEVPFAELVTSSGGKPSVKKAIVVPEGDPHKDLAYAKIVAQTAAAKDATLADPKKGDACPTGMVAKTMTDAFKTAKADGKYVFDVVCDLETKACEGDRCVKEVCEGGACTKEMDDAKYLEVLEERQNTVYRFLNHIAVDMDVINAYFTEFQVALGEAFRRDPEKKRKMETALTNLQFVYSTVERDMVYCSAKLRDAKLTSQQSLKQALSDLAFQGCDLRMTTHLLNATKVLYFRRMQKMRHLMETIVTGYDFHKFRAEREASGITESWFSLGNWGPTGISIGIRERFASARSFVSNALGVIGAKTVVGFVAAILAYLVISGALVPSAVLASYGLTGTAAVVEGAAGMAGGWYAGISSTLSSAGTSVMNAAIGAIGWALPGWAMYLVAMAPTACVLLGRADVLAKTMSFLRGQIRNYASGTGHVYQPIRNLLAKVGTVIQTKKRIRSAILRSIEDPAVQSQQADYEWLRRNATTPEIGVKMEAFLMFCNMFIGGMKSKYAQGALWVCRTVSAVQHGSVMAFAAGTASALGTVTAAVTGNSNLEGALAAGQAIFDKANGKDVMPESLIAEINKMRTELGDAITSEEFGKLLPGMTAESMAAIEHGDFLEKCKAILDTASFDNLVKLVGPMKAAKYAIIYLPIWIWKWIASVDVSVLLAMLTDKVQAAWSAAYKFMFDVAPEAATWVYRSASSVPPEQILKETLKLKAGDGPLPKYIASRIVDAARDNIAKGYSVVADADKGTAAKELSDALAGGPLKGEAKRIFEAVKKAQIDSLKVTAAGMSADGAAKVAAAAKEMTAITKVTPELVLVPEDATAAQVCKVMSNATQKTLTELVKAEQKVGVFNTAVQPYSSFNMTLYSSAQPMVTAALGAPPVSLKQEDFLAALREMQKTNPEYHEAVTAVLDKTGVPGVVVLPRDFFGMSMEPAKLEKVFASPFQQEMAYYTEGMKLNGDGQTYAVKVSEGVRWVKNTTAESMRIAGNAAGQAYGFAAQKVGEFIDLPWEQKAWFLCTFLLAMLTFTAVNWATSMAQEEVFDDAEKENAEVMRLLKESNGSLEKSLDTFGRIRAVPNAAAVYQRARTVHGLDPQAALQAVAQAYSSVCPPGVEDCGQPNKDGFDTSAPGHQADLAKLAQSGLSRKDQERLMAEKITSLLTKTKGTPDIVISDA